MTIQWSESLRWVIRNADSHSTRRQYHPTRLETQEPSIRARGPLTLSAGGDVRSTAIVSIGTGERGADGQVPPGAGDRTSADTGTIPSFDALLPPDIAGRAESAGVAKATMRFDRLAVLSVLAGAFISLGAMFSTVVTAGGGMAPVSRACSADWSSHWD